MRDSTPRIRPQSAVATRPIDLLDHRAVTPLEHAACGHSALLGILSYSSEFRGPQGSRLVEQHRDAGHYGGLEALRSEVGAHAQGYGVQP